MFFRRRNEEHYLPDKLNVPGPNHETVDLVRSSGARCVAEIGIYEGGTSAGMAEVLSERDGELHLFDFQDRVDEVAARLRRTTSCAVVTHGNSRKIMDSYNWSLALLLEREDRPTFDYVFIDGSHLWHHDALAFVLADRMLAVGGIMDFDDYTWSIAKSQTMNPTVMPATTRMHTDEQIEREQVKMVVELLVRADPRYEEIVPSKAFRKVA